MKDALREVSVICENQESFCFAVESADWEESCAVWYEADYDGIILVAYGAHVTGGLVDDVVDVFGERDSFSVEGNGVVFLVYLEERSEDYFSVDLDSSCEDDIFCFAS